MGSSTVRGTRVHQTRVPFYIGPLYFVNITSYSQFSETQLTHIPTATLSSLTFLISLSLSQSCYQLSLTFSISLSNSPTRSQSPFQSHSRSHSHSPSPSRSVARSPFRSFAWSPSRFVAHALDLLLTRYVSLSLHLQFEH